MKSKRKRFRFGRREKKNMKRKVAAVVLCAAMTASMLGACGSTGSSSSADSASGSSASSAAEEGSSDGKKVEIEFVQVKREASESYDKVIAAFEEKYPNIVIKQNVVPDAQEVLMTRASSDSLPDMMNHWPTDSQFVQFEDEGLLLDLTDKDYMKNLDSQYLDSTRAKDGQNYMAPFNINFMGIYYNKDKFDEAGFEIPTKWDDLINIAQQIKDKGETAFILPNKDSWTVSQLWANLEGKDLGEHSEVYEKMNKGEESFSTIPEFKSSVEKMIQLLDYAEDDSLALGYDQAVNDFVNGEGWMFIQGSWTLASFLSANPDFNVEFSVLPNDNGNPIAIEGVDTGFCVNAKVADDKDKMEAIDTFLSFLLSPEGAQIYADNDKSPSCVTGVTVSVPQFQPFFDYVEENGFQADGAVPPTGFEDTKRGKIQNVLLDKDVDAFLKEMSDDWAQAVADSAE